MFTHVLVPLDGSSQAERALPIAVRIARASGSSVALVRVVRAPVEFELGMTPPATWAPAARPEEREEAAAYLEAIRLRDILAGMPTATVVYAGPPAQMILAAATSAGADLIVLTSHGRTGMARWLLGSVAAEVARESSVPVLVLRGSALGDTLADALSEGAAGTGAAGAARQAAHARPLSALVPLDGSLLAQDALRPALALLGALAGSSPVALHLLSVVQPLPMTETAPLAAGIPGEGRIVLTEVDKAMLGEAEEYLCAMEEQVQREAAQLLPGRSVVVTRSAVWNPDVAHTIVSFAQSGHDGEGTTPQASRLVPSDLIVMATHGHGGLERWVMGSVTDRVLHATQLPLLVVRPTSAARPQENSTP